MSRGPGHVQRTVAAAFEAEPKGRFTTRQLAALAYPGETIERRHLNAVTRAIAKVTPALTFSRVGARDRFGWHHVWGRT